jgi:Exocyst complex component Sec10
MEFRSIKSLVDGSFDYIIEPLNIKIHRKSVDSKITQPVQEDEVRTIIESCMDSISRAKKNSILDEIESGLLRSKKISAIGEDSSNSAQLITVVLDTCYTGIFLQILNRISSCLEFESIKGVFIGKLFYMIADLAGYIRDFNKEIAKKISNYLSVTDLDRCESLRKRVSANIDQKLMNSLQQCISLMISESDRILQTCQKKTDYCALEESLDNTEACSQVYEYLLEQINSIKKSLPFSQYSKLLTRLGQKLTSLVVNHISKFTVSQEKALLLSSDMNKYRNLILLCENEKVEIEFEKFRQMMNLFMLNANSLPEFIHEEPIASIETQVLAQFISHRKDFKTGKVSKLLPSIFNA